MRARLALAISGTRVELREVKLSAKPDAMRAVSPKATVPILVLPDGQVIDESIDIMRAALTRRDPEGWLKRDDPALIAANDGPFKQDLDRYKYPERHNTDAATHRAAGATFLQQLERRLSQTAHLSGDTRGMTDAAIFPFVRQFVAVDPEWFAAQPFPGLKRWLSDHLSSDLFAAIMLRVPPWTDVHPPLLVDWTRPIAG